MKLLMCCCLAVAFLTFASAGKLSDDEETKKFEEYLGKFNIRVGRSDTKQVRDNFLRNYYDIEKHNEDFKKGLTSYEREVNVFSRFSDEEFFARFTGYIPGSLNASDSSLDASSSRRGRFSAAPASYSWMDKPNIIGPATDQGACGSCTIFATIGAIESHMRIWYGVFTKLSEQEAMQCCGGCEGGTNSWIYDYAITGAAYDKDLKYAGKVLDVCNRNRPRVPGSKVTSYYRIEAGADAVKNGMYCLFNVGPLATGMCVPGSFGSYKSGVFSDENMNDCGWHAVMIVGYGTENGKDFWMVRNSWGTGWGMNGFIKIARGKNLCRMENDLTYPVLSY